MQLLSTHNSKKILACFIHGQKLQHRTSIVTFLFEFVSEQFQFQKYHEALFMILNLIISAKKTKNIFLLIIQ